MSDVNDEERTELRTWASHGELGAAHEKAGVLRLLDEVERLRHEVAREASAREATAEIHAAALASSRLDAATLSALHEEQLRLHGVTERELAAALARAEAAGARITALVQALDAHRGTPCEQMRHEQEMAAERERANEWLAQLHDARELLRRIVYHGREHEASCVWLTHDCGTELCDGSCCDCGFRARVAALLPEEP